MKLRRRDLLKLGAVQVIATSLPDPASAAEGTETELMTPRLNENPSILQGATDDTKTQFSILYDEKAVLEIYALDSVNNRIFPDDYKTFEMKGEKKKITKVYFSGLRTGENYILKVVNYDNQKVLDTRQFQTLDLSAGYLRFALCSCMDDKNHKAEIWKDIVSKNPHVIFFVGDAVYADKNTSGAAKPSHLWKRFCEARQTLDIYFSEKLIPILATWDDHDFGLNDSHSENYPYVNESQQNFMTFFAQEESYCDLLKRGPGVSSAFQFGEQLFLLLDDRSFRKRSGSQDRFAHWGQAQEEWMMQLIRNHRGPTWFFNGSQIFPEMVFKESVSGDHKVQFKGLIEELKRMSSKVIFASGDVHFSEISQIEPAMLGYQTYELTSSSIHSSNIPGVPGIINNPRRIAGTGSRNYLLVEAVARGSGVQFVTTSLDPSGKVLFQKALEV